jgi:hypothetical protein
MSAIYLRSFLTVTALCIIVLQSGCIRIGPRPEHAIITPHIGDQGITKAQDSATNSITVNTGLLKSSLKQGSVFLYDNPVERWEATTVDSQNITWRNSSGDTKLTTLSMILPALRWNGALKSGRRIISAVSGSLHPLKKGNKVTFFEDVFNTRPPGGSSGYWECEVQDNVTMTVPAGTFNTWQILCKVNGREHILINYAEQLSNNVRTIRVSENNNTTSVRQLIAVSLAENTSKNATESKKNNLSNPE